MASKGSGTIRRCGFVGVGVALLKEVCHYESRLYGLIYAQIIPSEIDHFLLPLDQDVEFSSTMSACIPPCSPQ